MREYRVIYGESIEELEKEVNIFLAKGWKTCGGIQVLTYRYENKYNGITYNELTCYQSISKWLWPWEKLLNKGRGFR